MGLKFSKIRQVLIDESYRSACYLFPNKALAYLGIRDPSSDEGEEENLKRMSFHSSYNEPLPQGSGSSCRLINVTDATIYFAHDERRKSRRIRRKTLPKSTSLKNCSSSEEETSTESQVVRDGRKMGKSSVASSVEEKQSPNTHKKRDSLSVKSARSSKRHATNESIQETGSRRSRKKMSGRSNQLGVDDISSWNDAYASYKEIPSETLPTFLLKNRIGVNMKEEEPALEEKAIFNGGKSTTTEIQSTVESTQLNNTNNNQTHSNITNENPEINKSVEENAFNAISSIKDFDQKAPSLSSSATTKKEEIVVPEVIVPEEEDKTAIKDECDATSARKTSLSNGETSRRNEGDEEKYCKSAVEVTLSAVNGIASDEDLEEMLVRPMSRKSKNGERKKDINKRRDSYYFQDEVNDERKNSRRMSKQENTTSNGISKETEESSNKETFTAPDQLVKNNENGVNIPQRNNGQL